MGMDGWMDGWMDTPRPALIRYVDLSYFLTRKTPSNSECDTRHLLYEGSEMKEDTTVAGLAAVSSGTSVSLPRARGPEVLRHRAQH